MSSEPCLSHVVMLVGANAAALESLRPTAEILKSFGINAQTFMMNDAGPFRTFSSDVRALIVASGDAELPAALAAGTDLPVIRVPVDDEVRRGMALLIDGDGNLPAGRSDGVFATMAIGQAGAKNAALFVVSSLGVRDERLHTAWVEYRTRQTAAVLRHPPLTLEGQ